MNTLGVGSKCFAFAGKSGVYVRMIPSPESATDNADEDIVPDVTFPPECVKKDAHIECIAISKEDKIIAVGDSDHGLYLFGIEAEGDPKWNLLFSGSSSKRVIKLQFTSDSRFLTFLDKQGDIWGLRVPQDTSNTPVIKKLMGHTSFISDYVARTKSNQIVSCDRDEKIRVSNFPDAYVIQGFKLGHTESVISIAALDVNIDNKNCTVLLSISLTGELIVWDLKNPASGTETDFLHKWNVVDLLPEKPEDAGVKSMKATLGAENNIFFTVALTGSTDLHLFEISLKGFSLKYVLSLDTKSVNAITEWARPTEHSNCLIVFTPELGSVRCFNSSCPEKKLSSDHIRELTSSDIEDLKESAKALKPIMVPMKKRQAHATPLIEDHQSKKVKA